jgi:hypothetical protein
MKLSEFSSAIGVVVAFTASGSAQGPRGKDLDKPLVIATTCSSPIWFWRGSTSTSNPRGSGE